MPAGNKYSKILKKWVKTDSERKQNYDIYDDDACALLVSYWRWYPDKFLDLIESETADYSLEIVQRVNMRAFCRYQTVFITGSRGTTKTYVAFLGGNMAHNMKDAIAHGNRLIMMQEGHIIVDVEGEEKQKLTVEDLLKLFAQASGREFTNDRAILA